MSRAGATRDGAEEGGLLVRAQTRGGDVGVNVGFGRVMRGDFVELAAFLVEPKPVAFAVRVEVFDVHADDGADGGEAEDHHGDECLVMQANYSYMDKSAQCDLEFCVGNPGILGRLTRRKRTR